MPNQLAASVSLYLRQHAENPVDWFPWSEEAFDLAVEHDKPVLLSIGYSSCHWCHVMAHECFEDQTVAAVLNDQFISIKVDREERPDVDDAFMTAVQLSTGRGGWPMTIVMTPDRKPFFAGTYIPKFDRGRQPGFLTICRQISMAWAQHRDEIQASADEFAIAINESISAEIPSDIDRLTALDIEDAVQAIAADYDAENGGFGSAPKFPPHSTIEFLIAFAKSQFGTSELREKAHEMARFTMESMVRSGLHDQVGGGFHRYSTDAEWHLPHFEKMLYDNALMIRNMHQLGMPVTQEIRWLRIEMLGTDGLFYASIDADSDGAEGAFYTWSVASLRSVLGSDAEVVIREMGASLGGNFAEEATGHSTGENVLDYRFGQSSANVSRAILDRLLEARETRPRPTTDTKAVVAWNGLMIWALAESGEVELAIAAADRILCFDPVPHAVFDGDPLGVAYLDDLAFLCRGLIALSVATAKDRWRDSARVLCSRVLEEFRDASNGGFYSTSSAHEYLFGKHKPVFDNPAPSANAVVIECLALIGMTAEAEDALHGLMGWMHRAPHATEAMHRAAMYLIQPGSSRAAIEPPNTVVFPARDVLVHVTFSFETNRGEVNLIVPEGWYLQGPDAPFNPIFVRCETADLRVDWPTNSNDFRGESKIHFALVRNEPGSVEIVVGYQACTDDTCLLPMERSFDFRIDGDSA